MSSDEPFCSLLSAENSKPASAGFSSKDTPNQVVKLCVYSQKAAEEPLFSRQPCDVVRLILVDHTTGAVLKAESMLTLQQVGEDVPPHIRDDLKEYDIVLERVVDYVGRRIDGTTRNAEAPKQKMVFRASANYVGSCGNSAHPHIEITPITRVHCEPKQVKLWKEKETSKLEFVGWPSHDIENPIGFLAPFWAFGGEPQAWRVAAYGCGIRESGSPLEMLVGLARVYSHDEYEFSFSFPAALGYAAEKTGSVNVKREHSHSSSSSLTQGGQVIVSSGKSDTLKADGSKSWSVSNAYLSDGKLNSHSASADLNAKGKMTNYQSGSSQEKSDSVAGLLLIRTKSSKGTDWKPVDGARSNHEISQEGEIRPAVSLKKNGQEADVTKFLNNYINLADKIKTAIEDIQKLVPSVGWKVSLELKIMEGSITGKWGVQNGEDIDPNDGKPLYAYQSVRYFAVRKYYAFEFAVVVFGATLTLMVGVEVKVNAVFWNVGELVIKLEGKLSGEARLQWTVTSDLPVKGPRLECVLKGSVSGVCRVNAAGFHLVDASADLTGGLKFTAVPHVNFDIPLKVDGNLDLLATVVTYYGTTGKEPPEPVVVPIYDAAPLWAGNLLDSNIVS